MSFRGQYKVQVVEDHCATRERFTFETAVRSWVEGPGSRPKTAVCFKDGGKVGPSLKQSGQTIKNNMVTHDDIMVQTSEKGSYKVDTLLEYLDWVLPVADLRSSDLIAWGGSGVTWVRGHLGWIRTHEFQA